MQAEVLGQGGQLVPVGLSDRAVLEDDAGGHQTRQGEQYVSQFHERQGSVREGPQGRGICSCNMAPILSFRGLSVLSPPGWPVRLADWLCSL